MATEGAAIIRVKAEQDPSVKAATEDLKAKLLDLKRSVPKVDIFEGIEGKATVAGLSLEQIRSRIADVAITSQRATDSTENWKRKTSEVTKGYQDLAAAARVAAEEAGKASDRLRDSKGRFVGAGGQAQGPGDSSGITGAAGSVSATLAAGSLSILAFGASAVTTSGRMEQLRARLVAIKGSVAEADKAFGQARREAAKTPFDVEGVVDAVAVLDSFKVGAERSLPFVTALAAGTTKGLKETNLVLAKAFSGSSEGFESLRNEYGITTQSLKENGAVVTKNNELILKGAEAQQKAREALERIIQTRFGDAVARQAATFAGGMSNAGDAVTNLLDSFGQTVLPSVSLLIRGFISVTDSINEGLSPGLKGMIVVGGLAAGAFGLLTAGALAAVAGISLLNTQLVAAATQVPALGVAARVTGGLLTGMGTGASVAGRAITALAGSPVGALALLAAAVAAVGTALIDDMAAKAESAGKSVTESANSFAKSNKQYRDFVDIINGAGGNISLGGGDLLSQSRSINEELGKFSSEQLVQQFQKADVSSTNVKDKLSEVNAELKRTSEQFKALKEAENLIRLADDAAATGTERGANQAENLRAQAEALLKNNGLDFVKANAEAVTGEMKNLETQMLRLQGSKQVATALADAFKQIADPIDKAVNRLESLKEFLKFSKEIDSVKSLSAAIKELKDRQAEINSIPAVKGKSREQLAAILADEKSSETTKKAARASLEVGKELQSFQEKLDKKNQDAVEQKFKLEELAFRRRRALGETTTADELLLVDRRISGAKKGSEEEVKLLEEKQRLAKELQAKTDRDRQKALTDARTNLASTLGAGREQVDETRAEGGGAARTVQALDGVLARLEDWKQANVGLLNQSGELRNSYNNALRGVSLERQREAEKIPKENFSDLKASFQQLISESDNNAQKLVVTEKAIEAAKLAQKNHLITAKDATQFLVGLEKDRIAINKQIAAEALQTTIELDRQKQQLADKKIAELEFRKDGGDTTVTDDGLAKAKAGRFESFLRNLENERKAEVLAKGQTEEQKKAIDERYKLIRQSAIQDETLRIASEYQKQAKAKQDAFNAPVESPINSLASGINLGNFNLGRAFQFGNAAPGLTANRALEQARGTVQQSLFKVPFGPDTPGSAQQKAGDNFNVVINIDGRTIEKSGDGGYLDDLRKRSAHANNVLGRNRNPIQRSTKL